MKVRWSLCLGCLMLAGGLNAQNPPGNPGQKEAEPLATRMLQLIESTAVAVPGLIRASEPLRQNAGVTLAEMQRMPDNAGLTYQFMNQVKAYLALSDSIPRPDPFPATADQQYSELRDSLQRMQQRLEALLQMQRPGAAKREVDPNDLKRYAEADSKMLPPTKLPRVVFLGDSITDSWRLNEYFTGRDFVNRGIAGQTSLQMLARFRQDVVSLNPKAVVILAGTNDIAAGIALHQIEDNLTSMGELAKAHGIKPVFASVLPARDQARPAAAIQMLNRWLQTYCQNSGFVYMDYYAAMADQMGQMKADLSDDGLQPNSKGYRIMSPIAVQGIDRALAGQDQEQDGPNGKRRFKILSK
jgi:lysophospholipase L1-like esterase